MKHGRKARSGALCMGRRNPSDYVASMINASPMSSRALAVHRVALTSRTKSAAGKTLATAGRSLEQIVGNGDIRQPKTWAVRDW